MHSPLVGDRQVRRDWAGLMPEAPTPSHRHSIARYKW
jgi:hypothetical protein